jgi:cell division protein FtsW (lipid II flippase)
VRFPYTESLYMTLLLHGGVVLLGVFLLLALALLEAGLRARDGPEDAGRAAGRVLVVGVVLLTVMHLFEPYFLNTGMAHLLWITAALAAAAAPARSGA